MSSPRHLLARRAAWIDSLTLLGVLVALIALFSCLSDHFFSLPVLTTIANQIPGLTIVAVGMTFVLIVGGIDLSVGSVMALTGTVFGALAVTHQWSTPAALICALLCATACGLANGWITVTWAVPSFIVTLGMMEVARGAAYLATNSQTIYLEDRLEVLAPPSDGFAVSWAFVLALGTVAACQLALRHTPLGRHCIAAGDNAEALRLSGIDPRRPTLIVFVFSAFLAGVAGLFTVAHLTTADPNGGVGMELAAIAAVVIGGTSLTGGRGSVVRSFLGVLIIVVLQSGLAQIGASDPIKRIITGGVIVLAVIGDALRRRFGTGVT